VELSKVLLKWGRGTKKEKARESLVGIMTTQAHTLVCLILVLPYTIYNKSNSRFELRNWKK